DLPQVPPDGPHRQPAHLPQRGDQAHQPNPQPLLPDHRPAQRLRPRSPAAVAGRAGPLDEDVLDDLHGAGLDLDDLAAPLRRPARQRRAAVRTPLHGVHHHVGRFAPPPPVAPGALLPPPARLRPGALAGLVAGHLAPAALAAGGPQVPEPGLRSPDRQALLGHRLAQARDLAPPLGRRPLQLEDLALLAGDHRQQRLPTCRPQVHHAPTLPPPGSGAKSPSRHAPPRTLNTYQAPSDS